MQEFEQLDESDAIIDILYDNQFIDEEGNVYPIAEDEGIEPYCNHTFVSGKGEYHIKLSDGGCKVNIFQAQRCSKCGYVIQGDLLNTITYKVCPH